MSAFAKKLLPILVIFMICSCKGTAPSDITNYWATHKNEYKQLAEYSKFLDELGITDLNQYRIRTKSQNYLPYADIKFESPKYSEDIFKIVENLKKLDADMGIGKEYCSFFIKSGGVLESDEWFLFTENETGFEAFKNDILKLGYKITSQDELEKHWYFIVTD